MTVIIDELLVVGDPTYIDFVTLTTGGGSSSLPLVHDQTVSLATWTITHSFSYLPQVTIIDIAGKAIYTDIEYSNATTVVLTFNSPTTGKAILR